MGSSNSTEWVQPSTHTPQQQSNLNNNQQAGSSTQYNQGQQLSSQQPQQQRQMLSGQGGPSFKSNATFKFKTIKDQFQSIDQVQDALRKNGLESSELIVGIDFTKSNEWQGKRTFNGRSLHDFSAGSNPYMEAIAIIARTLAAFDDDQLIPVYGFGDVSTHAESVFSFYPNDQPCQGLESVIRRYCELTPHVKFAGPTSFGPIIRQAMKIVKQRNKNYHILLLLADGEITRPSITEPGMLSLFERDTQDAIIAASELPLSIIMIGVGDGPWDAMREFDDNLPARKFDNFQFVEFERLMRQVSPAHRDAQFAVRALMEIPDQYATILQRQLNYAGTPDQIHPELIPNPKDPPMVPPNAGGQVPQNVGYGLPQAPTAQHGRSSGGAQQPFAQQSVDEMFICPITQDIMRDPVIAGDGYTYDRKAISDWFKTRKTSPMTNQEINTQVLIPNNNLRSKIMDLYPNLR